MNSIQAQDLWVQTDHGRLFARRWPAAAPGAAPIVLLHDSLGCVELWRDFPERLALATGREVLAYDRLGFGRSDPHPGKLPVSFVRDEGHGSFRALREQLGLEAFLLFGHSVGGGMSVCAAAQYPDHCKALVTESAQAFVEDRTTDGIRTAQRLFAEPGQIDRLKRYHGDKAPWVLSAWIDTWLSPAFADWKLDEDLGQVRCPTLAMHGENDEYGSVMHPRRIAELSAGASTMRIFEGCGHVPHREMGEQVLGVVTAWLKASGN